MAEFGQAFTTKMSVAHYKDQQWSDAKIQPLAPFSLHPATHVLHYSSTCFEGLKAYRWQDGSIHLFRYKENIKRLRNSAASLCLPIPTAELVEQAILSAIRAVEQEIPALPGALYVRPTLIGTELNIGAAGRGSHEAMLYVITSPVGDYFEGGVRPLKLLIDDQNMRSTPKFGQVKTGGNYAASLGSVTQARKDLGADQVLFCPGGQVQETGAANFMVIKGQSIITKSLDGSILPGITRDSLLAIAKEAGYEILEVNYSVAELLQMLPDSEAFLSGTAAVVSPVGSLIYEGEVHQVGDGSIGPITMQLRTALTAIQTGQAKDQWSWTTSI